MPSLALIDVKAAHSEGYSSRCSATIRTARSRTSGEYLLDLGISPSSQGKESAQFPGRFRAISMPHLERTVTGSTGTTTHPGDGDSVAIAPNWRSEAVFNDQGHVSSKGC